MATPFEELKHKGDPAKVAEHRTAMEAELLAQSDNFARIIIKRTTVEEFEVRVDGAENELTAHGPRKIIALFGDANPGPKNKRFVRIGVGVGISLVTRTSAGTDKLHEDKP